MKNLALVVLANFLLLSCSKKKEDYATVKQDTVLDFVESFTGFEESRYLVSHYIEVLEETKKMDLKNKVQVQKWWDKFHHSHRCLRMLKAYKIPDKTFSYSTYDMFQDMMARRVLGDDFMNYSYLMTNIDERTRGFSGGDDEELYGNICGIPEKKLEVFQINYVINRNHPEFIKFNKKKREYKKEYKELYEKVKKIRSL